MGDLSNVSICRHDRIVDVVCVSDRGGGGGGGTRRRSSSRKRETRARREESLGSLGSPGVLEGREGRMSRYKEERRRQLASHVASRLSRSSAASSSEEEEREADKLSYTEYKRRRRQRENKAVTGSGSDLATSSRRSKLSSQSLRSSESCLPRLRGSPEHIYQSIGSELGLPRQPRAKTENHDSGRSVSPPPRRLQFSREGSVESSGETASAS